MQVHVDAVEIDEAIARVAKEQFGFEEGDRVKLHIENGLKFVERFAGTAATGKFSSHLTSFYYSRKTRKHIINITEIC